MLITKFNKMIRNRLIWGVIAFLVVMAFVVWGVQIGGDRPAADAGHAGMFDGETVGMEEFRRAYFNTYLSVCLSYGQRVNVTEEMDAMLNRKAWKRLASLKKAGTMGLPVTDDEVVAAIRELPFFVVDGRFSAEHYHGFTRGFLAQMGATEQQFENFMREELALKKLRYVLAQSVWVPHRDISRTFHRLYDEIAIKHVALMRDELDHMATVTEEDGWALFAQNQERFTIPEKMSVKFVEFRVEDFIDEAAVDDELLRKYYDEYIAGFIESGADDWDVIPSLDEVEEEVRAKAAVKEAEKRARDKAYAFELMLAPDRAGRAPSFEEAAAETGLPVSTTAFFAADETIEDLNVGPDFNEMAFGLRPTPDEYFSYPVKGEDAFYVLGYNERREPRIPDFEEVKDMAMDAARERAVSELLEELAMQVREAMEHDLDKSISFSESAASFGLEVFSAEPISMSSMVSEYQDTEKFYKLMRHAVSCVEGELTDIISIEDGFLIGYVESRDPGDPATYHAIRADLSDYVKQSREETMFDSWQANLLSSDRFEDFVSRRRPVHEEREKY